MKIDELNKVLHIKKAGGKSQRYHLSLDSTSIALLNYIDENRSEAVRTSIYNLYQTQFAVIKITNSINNRVLYLVDKVIYFYKKDSLERFLLNDSRVALDLQQHGLYAFDVSVSGVFKTSVLALDYRDYIINKELNEGVVLYNEEIYLGAAPRIYNLKIDNGLLNRFTHICAYKNLAVNGVLIKVIKKLVNRFKDTCGVDDYEMDK